MSTIEAAGEPGRPVGYPIYPVNPAGGEIEGIAAYRSVTEVPGPVDLAVVAVPAARVRAVVAECGEHRVGEVPSFGPLVMFGLGGVATELLGDRALSLLPLSLPDALEMIGSLRCSELLRGYRGAEKADAAALADLLCRVAALAEDLPEVVEMDLNPVITAPAGCLALDVKIRVSTPQDSEPLLRRRHLR